MGRIATLILGGLIGAGVMAATAKKTGSETRAEIKGALQDMKETATRANAEGGPSAVASEFVKKGKEVAEDAMVNGQAAAATATAKVQDVAADVTGSTDAEDLKRKIDEARARIVDRMATNAEGADMAGAGAGVNAGAQSGAAQAEDAVIESVEEVASADASATSTAGASATAGASGATSTASAATPGPGAGTADDVNGAHA